MCHLWEGKIEKCENCSISDYWRLFNSLVDGEPARPAHPQVAPMAQQQPSRGHLQPSRHAGHVEQYGNATVRNFCDREQAATHYSQPSASSHNAPANQTTQRKQERADTDQPSSSRRDALSSGTAQYKRQRMDSEHSSTWRLNSRINEQGQYARQRQTTDRVASSRQGTRIHKTAPSRQQLQGNHQLPLSRRDGRGQESYQDSPSAWRHYDATGSTGEDQHQTSNETASQNHPRTEDIEELIRKTNELPPPCWEDKRIFIPLIQEELAYETDFRLKEEKMNEIWGPYGKEREALAAPHPPELEEIWTPAAEEEEVVLEGEIPRWDEIWEGSVLQGEAWMRDILGEDEMWSREASEEVDAWTREPDGMLNSAVLKQLLRVFTLEELQRE